MPGVPGRGGPPPKRESQRRRVNKPVVPVDHAESVATPSPLLGGEHSDLGRRFWESLGRSGQSQFYEPSDWLAAELAVGAIDAFVKKPSAVLYQSIQSAMSNLLVTDGDRRRMRLELERNKVSPGSEQDADIARIADFRRTVTS